jgi:type II secretion system protein H
MTDHRPPFTDHRSPAAGRRSHLACSVRAQAGFTLLEMTIVIAILAVLMGLAIPRLRDTGATELRSQAHRLAMTFKLVRSEAILQGIPFQINFDLDEQRYWITSADPLGGDDVAASTLGRLARGSRFEGEVGIADVMLPAVGAKTNQGRIYTIFYPDGTVDPTVIHLASATQAYTLHLNPMSSRLEMTAGYVVPRYEGLQ